MGDQHSTVAEKPRLELSGISKRYGGVRAIRNADFTLEAGTVHALVGENGAGKSTVIMIVAGAERADTGSIRVDGEEKQITSTNDAIALGVQTVYQEPQLFPELSVAENIFIGRELLRGPRVDWATQADRVHELLRTVGLDESVSTAPVGTLSIAQQQQVSIAKALAGEARILILDEPSAILTDSEIDVLFSVIRRLTGQGVAVIYISHRLDELFRIADVVTVMRDGETIATAPVADLSVRQIAELMVGGVLAESRDKAAAKRGSPVLELEGLTVDKRFRNIDLSVASGEIVGLYGLIGSGAGDIASAIYGMQTATSGTIRLGGTAVSIGSPSTAKRRGIHLLPANRSVQGSFSFQPIAFNITIGELGMLSRVEGWVETRRDRAIAREFIDKLAIKTPSEKQPISAMSGGNAQKVVLARQVVKRPRVLVLVEPTQGVDVGAKEEIHRIIEQLADAGTAALVVTSDLGEAQRISDRLLVVRDGEIVAEFGPEASQVEILAAAAGDAGDAADSADTGDPSGGAASEAGSAPDIAQDTAREDPDA